MSPLTRRQLFTSLTAMVGGTVVLGQNTKATTLQVSTSWTLDSLQAFADDVWIRDQSPLKVVICSHLVRRVILAGESRYVDVHGHTYLEDNRLQAARNMGEAVTFCLANGTVWTRVGPTIRIQTTGLTL